MLNKFKKIIFSIFTIFFCFIIIYNLYVIICHYQTRNIYNQIEQIFSYKNFDNYDKKLESSVKNFQDKIKKYGNNTKCIIKKKGAGLSFDYGWISYNVDVYFYDDNDNVMNIYYYFYQRIIYIKKNNDIWEIDKIIWVP